MQGNGLRGSAVVHRGNAILSCPCVAFGATTAATNTQALAVASAGAHNIMLHAVITLVIDRSYGWQPLQICLKDYAAVFVSLLELAVAPRHPIKRVRCLSMPPLYRHIGPPVVGAHCVHQGELTSTCPTCGCRWSRVCGPTVVGSNAYLSACFAALAYSEHFAPLHPFPETSAICAILSTRSRPRPAPGCLQPRWQPQLLRGRRWSASRCGWTKKRKRWK